MRRHLPRRLRQRFFWRRRLWRWKLGDLEGPPIGHRFRWFREDVLWFYDCLIGHQNLPTVQKKTVTCWRYVFHALVCSFASPGRYFLEGLRAKGVLNLQPLRRIQRVLSWLRVLLPEASDAEREPEIDFDEQLRKATGWMAPNGRLWVDVFVCRLGDSSLENVFFWCHGPWA